MLFFNAEKQSKNLIKFSYIFEVACSRKQELEIGFHLSSLRIRFPSRYKLCTCLKNMSEVLLDFMYVSNG